MSLLSHPEFGRLARSVQTACSTLPWKGTCFRFAEEQWSSSQTLFSGKGAKQVGGRWSPPGLAAAYVSLDAGTAVEEWLAQLARAGIPPEVRLPGVLCSGECDLQAVLDLRASKNLRALGVKSKELLHARWEADNRTGHESLPQALGRAALKAGCEALLVPSAIANATNMVFLPGGPAARKPVRSARATGCAVTTNCCPLWIYAKCRTPGTIAGTIA